MAKSLWSIQRHCYKTYAILLVTCLGTDVFPIDRRIFVDTSAFYAASDRGDAHNRAIIAAMRRLVEDGHQLLTSNFVLAETHALAMSRLGSAVALRIVMGVRASHVVIRVELADESRAIEILTRYTDKSFSYTDATSFAVMERLSIGSALALDSDFRQYGLVIVPLA